MQEPLVLLPGMLCDARLYYAQIAAMSHERCVSIGPLTLGERIEEIASDLLTTLPVRFALAGSGMGASVALEMLRRAPERITRIALTDAMPMAETPQASAGREPLIIKARAGRFQDAVRTALAEYRIAPGAARTDIFEMLVDMAEGQGAEAFIRQLRAMQRRRDQQATLRRCRVPAMVICGSEASEASRKRHGFIAEFLHHAEFRMIDGAADLPMLENPRAYTQALRDWMAQPMVLR